MNIIFMGTPDFAVASLDGLAKSGINIQLVVTQPDRCTGRGRKLTQPPVKLKALELGIPVEQPESARDEFFINRVRSLSPDLIVVVAFGQILPGSFLAIPPKGCINVHGSLLPRYRGAAPVQRAVMNGDKVTGITTMLINERMDEGDILETRTTPIHENETAGDLFERLKILGVETLLQTVSSIEENRSVPVQQNSAEATYAPKIKKEERVVCWEKASREIYNIFRGLTPAPGVFSWLKRKRVIISECLPVETVVTSTGIPGEIVNAGKAGISVLTGNGETLLVKRVRPEGKREMAAAEFLSGHCVRTGERFCSL